MAEDETPPPPCSGEEFRQLDFWVGTWDLTWGAGENAGTGTNVITREMGNCVIEENFSGGGLIGNSLSLYHAPAEKWRQTWVDNQGGYFDLIGGPDDEGFRLDLVKLHDKTPTLRMIWRNIEADSLDWIWQKSEDEGKTWEDRWKIHYVRRAE